MDGVYGSKTTEALKNFWEKNPQEITGRPKRELSASKLPRGMSEKAEKQGT